MGRYTAKARKLINGKKGVGPETGKRLEVAPPSRPRGDAHLIAKIEAMSLQDFEQGQWLVEVWSELLGETVYFASTQEVEEEFGPLDGIAYTARELYRVGELRAQDLLAVHATKKKFNARIREGLDQDVKAS